MPPPCTELLGGGSRCHQQPTGTLAWVRRGVGAIWRYIKGRCRGVVQQLLSCRRPWSTYPPLASSCRHSFTCPVKSRSLLAGLLRAHAAMCCQEESLACMLGGTGGGDGPGVVAAAQEGAAGMQVALAARYHLASCLRCYVETAQPWEVCGLRPGGCASRACGALACCAPLSAHGTRLNAPAPPRPACSPRCCSRSSGARSRQGCSPAWWQCR